MKKSSQKHKSNNKKIFKYLQRCLADEYKIIIHHIRLSGTKMQELKLKENSSTRAIAPSTISYN
jgi:hypothetical protein